MHPRLFGSIITIPWYDDEIKSDAKTKISGTLSTTEMFSKLQTASAPSSKSKGKAPRNWKLSALPASKYTIASLIFSEA